MEKDDEKKRFVRAFWVNVYDFIKYSTFLELKYIFYIASNIIAKIRKKFFLRTQSWSPMSISSCGPDDDHVAD